MAEIRIKLANGEEAGKTMQEITKSVNAAATAMKKAEIGSKEFVAAQQKFKELKAVQEDLNKQTRATAEASNQLKESFGGVLNQIPGFSALRGVITQASGGVGGLTSSFGMLKGAIAATGVGLLVIAFTTLVSWMKKTDQGATFLSGVMKSLQIVFDMAFGKMMTVAKSLGEFFTGEKSIKQGLIDLVEFIGNNLLNRLKSFVVIWDGIKNLDLKKVTDGFIQLGLGVTNGTDKMKNFGAAVSEAVREGMNFEKQLDAIQDRARELSVLNAKNERDVERLIEQSKNVGLSLEERLGLLDRAGQLEIANHARQLENAKALEAFRKQELADNAKRGIQNDELDQQYADAQIKRIELERESLTLQEKIENRKSKLLDARTEAEKKAAAEELKVRQNIEQLKVEALEEGINKEIAQINLKTQEKIQALTGSEKQILEQKVLLEEIAGKEIQAVKDKYAQQAAEAALKEAEEQIKQATDEYNKKQKALEDHLEKVKQMEASAKSNMLNEIGSLGNSIADSYINQSNLALAQAQRRLDGIKEKYGEESAAFQSASDEMARLRKTEGEKIKRAQRAQVIINAVVEASHIWKNSSELGPWGIALAIIQTAALAIRTQTALKNIDATQYKKGGVVKAELGGMLYGPSHDKGGIPIEAEGGEFIFSKKAVAGLGVDYLTSLNNKFSNGGPVSPFESGKQAAVTSSQTGGMQDSSFKSLEQKLEKWITATNARIDRIKVYNVVTETEEGIKTVNQIRDEASV